MQAWKGMERAINFLWLNRGVYLAHSFPSLDEHVVKSLGHQVIRSDYTTCPSDAWHFIWCTCWINILNELDLKTRHHVYNHIFLYMHNTSCYHHFLGITKEMMSRGPLRLQTWSIERQMADNVHLHRQKPMSPPQSSDSSRWYYPHQLAYGWNWVLIHEVQAKYYVECHFNIWGIWVCCILEWFRFMKYAWTLFLFIGFTLVFEIVP